MEPRLDILFDELCVANEVQLCWADFERQPEIDLEPLNRIFCETLDLSLRRLSTAVNREEVNDAAVGRNLAIVSALLRRKGLPGAVCAVLLQYIVVVGKSCSAPLLSRHCEGTLLALIDLIHQEKTSAATVAAAAVRNVLRHVDHKFLAASNVEEFIKLWQCLTSHIASTEPAAALSSVITALADKALRDGQNLASSNQRSRSVLQTLAHAITVRIERKGISSLEGTSFRGLHRRITSALQDSATTPPQYLCDVDSLRKFLLVSIADRRDVIEELRTAVAEEETRRHELEAVLRIASQDAATSERLLADRIPCDSFQKIKAAVRRLGDAVSGRQ